MNADDFLKVFIFTLKMFLQNYFKYAILEGLVEVGYI